MKFEVENLLGSNEAKISFVDPDTKENLRFGVLLAESHYTRYYFCILLNGNGEYVETMRMADESKRRLKIFRCTIISNGGNIKVTVTINTEEYTWKVTVTK